MYEIYIPLLSGYVVGFNVSGCVESFLDAKWWGSFFRHPTSWQNTQQKKSLQHSNFCWNFQFLHSVSISNFYNRPSIRSNLTKIRPTMRSSSSIHRSSKETNQPMVFPMPSNILLFQSSMGKPGNNTHIFWMNVGSLCGSKPNIHLLRHKPDGPHN